MRRLLVSFAMFLAPALAQDPTPAQAAAAPAQQTAATAAAPAADAPAPTPSGEPVVTGYIDFGYRWRGDVGGSMDAYRTFVDLGSGPQILGADFTLQDPRKKLFDVAHVRATTWGGDPSETLHFDVQKDKYYRFSADYRNFAYFNNLPSFADPLLSKTYALDEQSFDLRRHIASGSLELFPHSWLVPYFAFDRDAETGTGLTTFVTNGDEYAVPERLQDATNLYRGGLRIQSRWAQGIIEEGGTTYSDNQNLYQGPGALNLGNLNAVYFGQTLSLKTLLAAYGIRGSGTYTKLNFTVTPTQYVDLFGTFLYSEPSTTVNYTQTDAGNLYVQNQLLFYSGQQYLVNSAAKLPHTTGSAGAVARPHKMLRITEAWMTDRQHSAGNSSNTNTYSGNSNPASTSSTILESTIFNNYSQNQIDVYIEASPKFTLRGGYRYVWGDAFNLVTPLEGLAGLERDTLHRHVGLGGFSFRPSAKLTLSADAEGASSTGAYFRSSLYNYFKGRAQARYQAASFLHVAVDINTLKNTNPTIGINLTSRATQESASLFLTPKAGKWGDLQLTYSRADLSSNINYLTPQNLQSQVSAYRDNSHTASGLLNLKLPHAVKFSAGGSMFLSSGSRPSSYYQPKASLWAPLSKHATLFAEWTYYGYGEIFYPYEGFRTHVFVAGMRLTK